MKLGVKVGLGICQILLNGDPAPLPKGHSPQIFGHVCCGQTAEWIKMPLGMEVRLGPGHIVLDGDLPPSPKGHSPQFSAHACCGETARYIKIWKGGRPRLWLHCVRWILSSLAPSKGHSPQFLAHVCCGQTVGWIKIPLGREVGLGPGHIVLDGDLAPSPKGAQPPIFCQCLLWPNGRPFQLLLSTCLNFRDYIKSFKRVKLCTLNLVCRLIVTSSSLHAEWGLFRIM